jgi:hypothetical protein
MPGDAAPSRPDDQVDQPTATYNGELTDQANRLLSRALHEDGDFRQVGNFFLIAESMMAVAYSGLLASGSTVAAPKSIVASTVIAVFGLLLAIVWGYVARRQWRYVLHVYSHAFRLLPEQEAIEETRAQSRVSGSMLTTYVVPGRTAAMWIMLLVLV